MLRDLNGHLAQLGEHLLFLGFPISVLVFSIHSFINSFAHHLNERVLRACHCALEAQQHDLAVALGKPLFPLSCTPNPLF